MIKNQRYTYTIIMAVVLTIAVAGSAFAGGSARNTSQPASDYETVEGVLSIKEGHGDFLIRLSNGRAQRFSVQAGADAVEITRNGKPVRYSELKRSDKIKVKYDATNRKVIEIHASGS